VTAVLRSVPLRRPSSLSAESLRHLARITDGITSQVFSTLNELAIDAIRTRAEKITDEAVEAWRPAIDKEAAYS
jgi:hypothetical protein